MKLDRDEEKAIVNTLYEFIESETSMRPKDVAIEYNAKETFKIDVPKTAVLEADVFKKLGQFSRTVPVNNAEYTLTFENFNHTDSKLVFTI